MMENAIDKLRADITEFLKELHAKRKEYQDSMGKDEVLANTKKILQEIKHLEKSIIDIVEQHLQK